MRPKIRCDRESWKIWRFGGELNRPHGEFIDETGLDLYQMFGDGNIESAAEVDIWKKKFVLGQSLYNPQALGDLGTQMYLLNKWYM